MSIRKRFNGQHLASELPLVEELACELSGVRAHIEYEVATVYVDLMGQSKHFDGKLVGPAHLDPESARQKSTFVQYGHLA
jgi:hypothetical protein